MINTSDPTGCQQTMGIKVLGYITGEWDADRRMKQGQKQEFCQVCDRFRWSDERCPKFVLDEGVTAFYQKFGSKTPSFHDGFFEMFG